MLKKLYYIKYNNSKNISRMVTWLRCWKSKGFLRKVISEIYGTDGPGKEVYQADRKTNIGFQLLWNCLLPAARNC